MGDKQDRQVHTLLQFQQQVDDLALDRHIQRRHAFIGNDQARLHRQRPGDTHALALAATEGAGLA